MSTLDYILILGYLALLFLFIYFSFKKKREVERIKEEYYTKDRKEFESKFREEIASKQSTLDQLDKVIKVQQQYLSDLRNDEENKLRDYIEEKKKYQEKEIAAEIANWELSAQSAANFNFQQQASRLNSLTAELEANYESLKAEVDDFKEKRDVINEEIRRRRALEEQVDFFRVDIPEGSRRDIEILNSIRPSLSKIDLLDKLLYDNYVKKPVDEMVKRVLKGAAPSGIYKITRLKTGEVYIGKSTDVAARWRQHTKSCLHCGTISHSTLHTTMEKDGIWNFTFELLEETSKDKLTEREKYWINFYDSKNYGLNEKV